MKKGVTVKLFIIFFFSVIGVSHSFCDASTARVTPNRHVHRQAAVVVATPLPSPVPSVSPSVTVEKISTDEAKKLLIEFSKAQTSELKALDHQQKTEMRELQASQKARQKEWEKSEKSKRHQYFKEHTQGPERRTYVRDFIERRKNMLSMMLEERKQRKNEQEVRMRATIDDQKSRRSDFEAALKKGERPSALLWH